jgi:hypothetical protein
MVRPPRTKSNQCPVGVFAEATIGAGLEVALAALEEVAWVDLAVVALARAGAFVEAGFARWVAAPATAGTMVRRLGADGVGVAVQCQPSSKRAQAWPTGAWG